MRAKAFQFILTVGHMSARRAQDIRALELLRTFQLAHILGFALTFDPISEATDESDQVPANATPSDTWTAVALRYFLYCWQRIGNNQERLRPEAIDKVLIALSILRSKV
jgi:hypothetical protein